MAKVRVYNDNTHDYKEVFKGEKIHIKAKGFIMMEQDEAYQFKGTFCSPVLDGGGNHLPEGFKMIRIEAGEAEVVEETPKVDPLKCIVCGYKATSQTDLDEHMKTHEHNLVVDEEAEAEIKKRGRRKPAA